LGPIFLSALSVCAAIFLLSRNKRRRIQVHSVEHHLIVICIIFSLLAHVWVLLILIVHVVLVVLVPILTVGWVSHEIITALLHHVVINFLLVHIHAWVHESLLACILIVLLVIIRVSVVRTLIKVWTVTILMSVVHLHRGLHLLIIHLLLLLLLLIQIHILVLGGLVIIHLARLLTLVSTICQAITFVLA